MVRASNVALGAPGVDFSGRWRACPSDEEVLGDEDAVDAAFVEARDHKGFVVAAAEVQHGAIDSSEHESRVGAHGDVLDRTGLSGGDEHRR